MTRAIRVGVDATSILDIRTGLENHALSAVRGLVAARHEGEVVAFVRAEAPPEWKGLDAEVRILPSRGEAMTTQLLLPTAVRRAGLDALYCPAKPAPVLASASRLLVGIHDAIPWALPDAMGRGAAPFFRTFHRLALMRGARVATPSQASAVTLRSVLGLNADRIHVVGNALPPDFASAVAHARRPSEAPPGAFILAVGRVDPRRDLGSILDAWEIVASEMPDLSLVLVGGEGWKVAGMMERARRMPRVRALGRVSAESLAGLYAHAECFVTASLMEGFGLTVLEALASGCPVVASGIGPHREVGQDAILTFPPKDPTALTNAVRRVLTDTDLAQSLAAAGRARAAAFTEDLLGQRLWTALEAVVVGDGA